MNQNNNKIKIFIQNIQKNLNENSTFINYNNILY